MCTGDLRAPLQLLGAKARMLAGTTCLSGPVMDKDANPSNGVQADCTVVEEQPSADGGIARTQLPACTEGGPRPCWQVSWSPECAVSGQSVVTDRAGASPLPRLRQVITCTGCTSSDDLRCWR